VKKMIEKFTVSSIKSIMFAQSEAQRLGHALTGTELLLVGLVLEQQGLAAQALKSAGLDRKKVREGMAAGFAVLWPGITGMNKLFGQYHSKGDAPSHLDMNAHPVRGIDSRLK
jgi:hypothetical protein